MVPRTALFSSGLRPTTKTSSRTPECDDAKGVQKIREIVFKQRKIARAGKNKAVLLLEENRRRARFCHMQNKGTKKKPADIILMITAHQIGTNANESTALVHGFESFAYSFSAKKKTRLVKLT
ncbi:MAG: hypothetical protein NVV73_02900 [Cellvibrionaceae bacterium]|nr:hypothetical protein [Cellvibrionaceae bacterium]